MKLAAYKATGAALTAVKKLAGVKLRVSGAENIVDQPTMFVVNHFTRLETLIIPYAIYQASRRSVHCLASHTLFRGLLGKYLRAVGVISIRDPRRNKIIIRDLMTRTSDWVIYPEGGLIKNKETVSNGKLHLTHPHHQGPPHTGAAVLTLKAELAKRRYLRACENNDGHRRHFYEHQYGLDSPNEICRKGIVITPVNITFYPMRNGNDALARAASLLNRDLNQNVLEELEVEWSILRGSTDISVHFAPPIHVGEYLGQGTELTRRIVGLWSESQSTEVMLRRRAMRLTQNSMSTVYSGTELNFDHIFCGCLYTLESDRIRIDDFHRAVYSSAARLAQSHALRVHPVLRNGIAGVLTNGRYRPLLSIERMAFREGILKRENGYYILNRDAMEQLIDFHSIRVKHMTRVIANELQTVPVAVNVIHEIVNLPSKELRQRTEETLHAVRTLVIEKEVANEPNPGEIESDDKCEPFLLESPGNDIGVLLVHGYNGGPDQIRPMAEFLHSQGMTVHGIRLRGHCSTPEVLAEVSWNDWVDSVRHGYRVLQEMCSQIVIGGFSLGGILTLLFASEHPEKLAGVFTINAPFQLRDRRVPFLPAVMYWNTWMNRFGYHHARVTRKSSSGSSNSDLRSVREVVRAIAACHTKLNSVTAPTFMIQGDHDPIVNITGTEKAITRINNSVRLFSTISSDEHTVICNDDSEPIFRSALRFIQRLSLRQQFQD